MTSSNNGILVHDGHHQAFVRLNYTGHGSDRNISEFVVVYALDIHRPISRRNNSIILSGNPPICAMVDQGCCCRDVGSGYRVLDMCHFNFSQIGLAFLRHYARMS
jgi:hypothetical protein